MLSGVDIRSQLTVKLLAFHCPRNEVLRATKEVSDRGLQGILVNLRAQDRDRDGVLSTDMVKGSLKKFQAS